MYLVTIKFIEVFTRAVFIVGTTYSLSLASAGQFGIVATLVGLFAFLFNWERHIDIQRRNVDAPPEVFDRAVMMALPFWWFNQVLMLPVFVVFAALMAHLTPWQLLLAVVIVSCEHVANQTYQMALITRRYWHFLNIVAAKNIVVLGFVMPYILFASGKLTLNYVLSVWVLGQVICVVAVIIMWLRLKRNAPHDAPFSFRKWIFAQHRASFTHFQIGAVAIFALQFDRLAVGTLLPLADVGSYYRHVLAVSFVYQFFNVASYNRIVPQVFAMAKIESLPTLLKPIKRELAMVYAAVGAGFAAAFGIDAALGYAITTKYHLSMALAALLVAGAVLRVTADFGGMICHARMREALVLRAQAVSFAFGAVLLVLLTWRFGTFGTGAASVVTSALFLLLIVRSVRALPQGPSA